MAYSVRGTSPLAGSCLQCHAIYYTYPQVLIYWLPSDETSGDSRRCAVDGRALAWFWSTPP